MHMDTELSCKEETNTTQLPSTDDIWHTDRSKKEKLEGIGVDRPRKVRV